MTETVDLTLQRLIRMEKRQDSIDFNVLEIKQRASNLEAGQASIKTDIGHVLSVLAQIQTTLDRFDERQTRIERRLDLTEVAE
jgi:hypothetical protein